MSQAAATPKVKAFFARKLEMTQVFDAQGLAHPATVLDASPCRILDIRTKESHGYDALQLGFGPARRRNVSKALAGQFKQAESEPVRYVRELRVSAGHGLQKGGSLTVENVFQPGDYVDVKGVTKGHGFAGGMKRWNFRGGPATHGQSDRARAPGSLAGRRSLGRVLPGKKMAGHYGVETSTVYKMEVLKVDPEQHRLFIKGGVPGPRGNVVFVHETVKSRKKKVIHAPAVKKKAIKAAAPAKK